MFGRHKDYFSKKYRRRTYSFTFLLYVALMSAVREDDLEEGDGNFRYRNYRPFAPYTEVIGESEIKVSWLPVTRRQYLNGYYELYSGDELEYTGQDLVHISKRLHSETEYVYKLRVCSYVPGDCSHFSIPRYQMISTDDAAIGKRLFQILLDWKVSTLSFHPVLVVTVIIAFVAVIYMNRVTGYFTRVMRVSLDAVRPARKQTPTTIVKQWEQLLQEDTSEYLHKAPKEVETQCEKDIENICTKEKRFEQQESKKENTTSTNIPKSKSFSELEMAKKHVDSSSSSSSEELSSCEDAEKWKEESDCVKCTRKMKTRKRNRSKTTGSQNQNKTAKRQDKSASDSELCQNNKPKLLKRAKDCGDNVVVVIDNSNIFIGARETACIHEPSVKPRHVKLRINQLLRILEKGRSVSLGVTGASSPSAATEHVWDVYRKAGYTVDLEERRGKDEQKVDEQLHFAIFKALMELPPQTLVLATGDGHKGKSKLNTSFVQCAKRALEHGWTVEVTSWKHSLSVEWLKLSSSNKNVEIKYLDEHLDKLTIIERKRQRKSF